MKTFISGFLKKTMGELTFRFSTIADHDGIVRMTGESFKQVDGMQEIYPDLIGDPTFHGVVGESDGEIVAFGGAYITLGGTKLYSTGGRVRADWRDKRVYGQLKEYLRTHLKEEGYPLLTQEEFFTHGDNPALQNLLHSKTYKFIFKRLAQIYKLTSEKHSCFKRESSVVSDIQADSIGPCGLLSIFEDPESCRRIFPDRILIGMRMFDPVVQNFPLIEKTEPDVVVSYSGTSQDLGLAIVSTGRHYRSSQYFIQFHFNTDTAPLPPVLAEHIAKHVQKYIDTKNGFKQYDYVVLNAAGKHFGEAMKLIEFSGSQVFKFFEEPTIYGFCRDI